MWEDRGWEPGKIGDRRGIKSRTGKREMWYSKIKCQPSIRPTSPTSDHGRGQETADISNYGSGSYKGQEVEEI